ncbi:PIN domain-like protein [Cylindrobasidium torrendii FP15055 ss-10]|uniref:PIN domain-like protein n=1 Tax=Cylindrobasidium torrendii FP15055 ss-10 TaxID=1314674 RepID=A0A0D7BAL5_9AGAR|nr:PIN domain-like protein [Cylindrobasidium torrendii FP15055 ss-10]
MGVKSLWDLLAPVGRPVMLETMEGKTMAIDSSIWIYQFQATMRGKEGQVLVNAHILGFLRRICKLMFYGMKPVFVFDGGAPELKKSTLMERREKKSGAAASHAKLAEKLLAAQLRREAVKHVSSKYAKNKGKGKAVDEELSSDDAVYLEDVDPNHIPRKEPVVPAVSNPSPSKGKFYDHDTYKLPDVDLSQRVAAAANAANPDPRLATEDELRAFIEEMRPEDFDVTSPAFRELPTEVQYEIIGDMRLKSRQTSYTRLQQMLRAAPTPMDFSKQQIKNLKERNSLTQQLLSTTDSIGRAHIEIPVRIASERNKQYVLVRNDGPGGGWVLGIRDDGTKDKPILIDHEEEERRKKAAVEAEDDDDEMEEVTIPSANTYDPDLREMHIQNALGGIGNRSSGSHQSHPVARRPPRDQSVLDQTTVDTEAQDDDVEMSMAIQRSLDDTPMPDFPAYNASDFDDDGWDDNRFASSSKTRIEYYATTSPPAPIRSQFSPSPISNAFTLANTPIRARLPSTPSKETSVAPAEDQYASPAKEPLASPNNDSRGDGTSTGGLFGMPLLLLSSGAPVRPLPVDVDEDDTDDFEEVGIPTPPPPVRTPSPPIDSDNEDIELITPPHKTRVVRTESPPMLGQDLPALRQSPAPEQAAEKVEENWDAAQEMNQEEEEEEFARFVSGVKGRSLDDVRREIDNEITQLDKQRKAAMRDSEDVTQQMVHQIMTMLRLFGIPYITAPMEAEAQCAALVSLGLVDGIITDDSDVFLFGGERVFKNMFNQSKTVECFLSADLSRELGLDRGTLVRLAYLLGSDYVDGLPGVGPVMAMELLQEFPRDDGLHRFKEWWMKVQSGKDTEKDTNTPTRKRMKKKFKSLYLDSDWPNPLVRDAYYHPTVDNSEEPFKWGIPDLDALRGFLFQELGWRKEKVDDLLVPIIQKARKRGQTDALNKQGDLNGYFDVTGGSGTAVPRKKQAYASKRLQQVVMDYRRKRKAAINDEEEDEYEVEMEVAAPPPKKKGRVVKKKQEVAKEGAIRASSNRGKGRRKDGQGRKKKQRSEDEEDFEKSGDSDERPVEAETPLSVQLRPRPKPKPAWNSKEPE